MLHDRSVSKIRSKVISWVVIIIARHCATGRERLAEIDSEWTASLRALELPDSSQKRASVGQPSTCRVESIQNVEAQIARYSGTAIAGVSMLVNTVTRKLRHSATKPALQPNHGSRLLSIRKMTVATPAIMPAKTPDMVTRFQ